MSEMTPTQTRKNAPNTEMGNICGVLLIVLNALVSSKTDPLWVARIRISGAGRKRMGLISSFIKFLSQEMHHDMMYVC